MVFPVLGVPSPLCRPLFVPSLFACVLPVAVVGCCIPAFDCGCINFLGKKWLKNLDDIAGRSTFAPAFGRGHEYMDSLEGDGRGDSRFFGVAQRGFGKNFEKSCRKIWKGRKKVFIFAPAFAPKKGAGKQTKQE